ncbi:hypothetical protein DTO003C3_10289 [Penicillium roqueforti]|nr:hypothetical protein DTO003C3_10289 [Penicillium roqueforti]
MVNKYGFKDAAPAKTPLDTKTKLAKQGDYVANTKFRKEYQSKVGSLNFSSNQTRPDIAFATGYVARYASNPNRAHMDAVDRIFAYLKSDARKGIVYSDKHGLQLRGFVDSDFAGCEDSRKSTTGWVFTLAGGPISWSSQRQKTVATSTMDAEYIACAEAAKEAMWIRNFINDLRIPGERMYFDSSDFALSAAHRVTDLGAIQTDRAHPNRDNISHPSSPTPAANNVDKKTNEDLRRKDASPQKSHLHRQTNKDPTSEEEQDNFFYFED